MLKDKHFVDMLVDNQNFKKYAKRQRQEYDRTHSWKKHKKARRDQK